jgi:P27 family predicted phage terminase small subunit
MRHTRGRSRMRSFCKYGSVRGAGGNFCPYRDLYREALTKINRAGVAGMIVKTPSGILHRSPLMDVIRDLALEMRGYESEMGFTSASRSRVQVAQDAQRPGDPWADIAG